MKHTSLLRRITDGRRTDSQAPPHRSDSFTTRKVARWNNQCIHEMLRTGSVPMLVIEELQRVAVRVLT